MSKRAAVAVTVETDDRSDVIPVARNFAAQVAYIHRRLLTEVLKEISHQKNEEKNEADENKSGAACSLGS